MANIRKTFNFRNGVQVDEKNLLVNPLGLVGIGTTVPTQQLDVVGNVRISGFVTAASVFSDNFSVSNNIIAPEIIVGKVSIQNTGIITSNSGIITYYGDGSNLINLPTSQWLNVNTGGGVISIYSQGFVGVATNFPVYAFQVGGTSNLSNFVNGVGISSRGNIFATGIITATTFSGSFSGNGSNLTNLNASAINAGTIGLDYIPTLTSAKLPNNISVSGIITAQTNFSGNLVGNVTGNLTGTATTATTLPSTANITINSINSLFSNLGVTTTANLRITGNVGINTNSPQGDVHILSSSSGSFRLTSPVTSAFFIGKGLSNSNNGSLRYGNASALTPYSLTNSFDIINYDNGHVNTYIDLNSSSGVGTGNFNWLYGKFPFDPLMTLTYQGNLGIGISNPSETFEVVGTSTVTSNAYFGSNVSIKGTTTLLNTLTAKTINATNVNSTLFGNINATSGISTFNNTIAENITANNRLLVNAVTAFPNAVMQINDSIYTSVFTTTNVGIRTTNPKVDFDASNAACALGAVSVGSTIFKSAVDFSNAGVGVAGDMGRFILPPLLTSTQRNFLSINPNLEGAIIYNTTTGTHQGYNGTSWISFSGGGGGGTVGVTTTEVAAMLTDGNHTGGIGVTYSPVSQTINISNVAGSLYLAANFV